MFDIITYQDLIAEDSRTAYRTCNKEEKRMLEKNSLKDRIQKEKDKMEQFKNLAAEKFTKAADKLVQNQ